MDGTRHVYELDADAVVAGLFDELIRRGNDVVEQVPAGVWWVTTDKDARTVSMEISAAFADLVARGLREIEQDD